MKRIILKSKSSPIQNWLRLVKKLDDVSDDFDIDLFNIEKLIKRFDPKKHNKENLIKAVHKYLKDMKEDTAKVTNLMNLLYQAIDSEYRVKKPKSKDDIIDLI